MEKERRGSLPLSLVILGNVIFYDISLPLLALLCHTRYLTVKIRWSRAPRPFGICKAKTVGGIRTINTMTYTNAPVLQISLLIVEVEIIQN